MHDLKVVCILTEKWNFHSIDMYFQGLAIGMPCYNKCSSSWFSRMPWKVGSVINSVCTAWICLPGTLWAPPTPPSLLSSAPFTHTSQLTALTTGESSHSHPHGLSAALDGDNLVVFWFQGLISKLALLCSWT